MKKDKEVGGGPSFVAISDPRFARVHTDLHLDEGAFAHM